MVERFTSRWIAGIRFADYVFGEPVPLSNCWVPPQLMGLYVVLVPDPTWGPRQFQPIFFGVLNSQRPYQLSTEEYSCCLRVAAGKALYIATYNLPVYDPSESRRIQRELIQAYAPLCNREAPADGPSADLAHKLDALEKKNQEQEMLLKVILAAIGHLVQPPQEVKRRAVGFQPAESSTNRQSTPQRGVLQNSYCS